MSDASTLIVIPTYNEREVLADIIPAVRAAVPAATILIVRVASRNIENTSG